MKRLFAFAMALASVPAMAQLNFADPAVNGAYTGLATDAPPAPANRPSFVMDVSVGSNRLFTAKVNGLLASGSFRGTMAVDGTVNGTVNIGGAPTTFAMALVLEGAEYVINGTTSRAGVTLSTFKLRRSPYSKTNPFTGAGNYTYAASSPGGTSPVLGDLIGTASFASNGGATIRGYFPDGTAFSAGARVLSTNIVPFIARGGRSPTRSIGGSLTVNPLVLPVFSDLAGTVRIVRDSTLVRGIFTQGFDETRVATGSLFLPPAFQQMAATWFDVAGYNTVFSMTNGELATTRLIANWTPSAKMSSPNYSEYAFSGGNSNTSGDVWGSYQIKTGRNTSLGIVNNSASFRAVILQKQQVVTGFYLSAAGSGQVRLAPNTLNEEPNYTIIGPTSKGVSGYGGIHTVSVFTQGDWDVVIQPEATWVTSDIVGGTDDGFVTFTVERNETNFPRSTTVLVAGESHFIYQAARPSSISPAKKSIGAAGGTYYVSVNTIGAISADVVTGADWITTEVDDTTRIVTITIAANTLTTPRTGTVNIAGKIHTVTQSAVSVKLSASKSPYVSARGASYVVKVTSDGPWTIVIPTAATWVTVAIDGEATTALSSTGTKNVTITVAPYTNASAFPVARSATITIGGKNHVVTQDWKYR